MSLDTLGGMHPGRDSGANEQRVETRVALTQQPPGRMALCTAFEQLAPRHVRDVSARGISMEIDRPVAANTQVQVEYLHEGIDLRVNGRVAWLREPDPSAQPATAYVVGIELFSPGLLLNFLPVQRLD